MKRKLIPAIIAGLFAVPAWAMEPFVIKDIRVEGIQRTEAGTVFSYLPVKVGDTLDDKRASEAIKALYATGFFKDVNLEVQGDVLIVNVAERPAIAEITFNGLKEFNKDQLKDSFKQIGLAESRILDRSVLDKAEQEMKRQYFSRGKYAVDIKTTVTPLERNRVAITFDVNEGDVAKIKQIHIIGAKAFKESDLLDMFAQGTSNWLSWYTKNDQYSKQKLQGDLENLRSFYLNRGYLEFAINSTQVSISPDKRDIYVTLGITEGEKYTVTGINMGGKFPVPEDDLRKLITLKSSDAFSREKLTASTKAIADRLGEDGYAFANVNAAPELDKEKHEVSFTFLVDPGRRTYVRHINVTGNTKTRDEVVRREFRQMENAWYSNKKIDQSKTRLNRLGFFSDVNLETPAVTGTTDQVDLNVNVAEKPTGSIMLGAGYSSSEGFILSGSVSQNNVFGSGNQLALQLNSGRVNKVYSLSYTNPYFTPDGVSLGYDVYQRNVDTTMLQTAPYTSHTTGGGARLGVPFTEVDTVFFGLSAEATAIGVTSTSPQRYIDFVNQFGNRNTTVIGSVGWARDERDSLLYPTKGTYQRFGTEWGMPVGDIQYYKASYQRQWFYPLSQTFTLMLNGELGMASGMNGQPLPFYKSFYAGGNTSVRGFDNATIGPKDYNGLALGGTKRVVVNAELFFPFPGMHTDKSVRMSAFVDAGGVWGPGDYLGRYVDVDGKDLRYSAGVGVSWLSPVGPLRFSLATPLKKAADDRTQRFQFMLGTTF